MYVHLSLSLSLSFWLSLFLESGRRPKQSAASADYDAFPIAASFAYGAHYKPFHDDATFKQALAMNLLAAEKYSRFR